MTKQWNWLSKSLKFKNKGSIKNQNFLKEGFKMRKYIYLAMFFGCFTFIYLVGFSSYVQAGWGGV